jgi:hypothetical protein
MSTLRNLSLKPLKEMALEGVTYDKILFLNDVAFTVSHHLFSTLEASTTYKIETISYVNTLFRRRKT